VGPCSPQENRDRASTFTPFSRNQSIENGQSISTCENQKPDGSEAATMNLHHLRIFYTVARRMSLTKAAEDLRITQPAVTNQIRAFEERLGLKLFRRKPGMILLTEEGKILPYCLP
jgi:DNA-binding MarR family transcriptional regulator